MKSNILILFILLLSNDLFSLELWNGFTSQMDINDVKNRLNNNFSVISIRKTTIWYTANTPSEQTYRWDLLNAVNYDQPDYYSCVMMVRVLNSEYRQNNSYNLMFGFYNEKLFFIKVTWPSDEGLLNMAIRNIGNYSRILNDSWNIRKFQLWNLNEKDFILDHSSFWYFDRLTYQNELLEKQRQERLQEEVERRRRQEANSGVQF